ncbi:MAG: GNAT family N-acetyltransferase [Spirochaetales bacterium]|nr:GNAT family N-acetyltransferase [Spirochaetales bacterium]MCF7938189.1 GNAT family N-acetyltransferase [Spirochaetales bacterium]
MSAQYFQNDWSADYGEGQASRADDLQKQSRRLVFDLTDELMDQIIYSMENQEENFYYDVAEQQLVSSQNVNVDDTQRFVPIPPWVSADGFQLMERFVSQLRNPVYHDELKRALSAGRGVFRAFKNTIKQREELERAWYQFKEQQMRRIVLEWYNDLRDLWGLEKLEALEEETDDLVLSEFQITEEGEDFLPRMRELYKQACYDSHAGYDEEEAAYLCEHLGRRQQVDEPVPSVILTSRSPVEELAGCLWAAREEDRRGRVYFWVRMIYIEPEFRGFGMAKQLIEAMMQHAHREDAQRVFFDFPGRAAVMERYLSRIGGSAYSLTYGVDTTVWYQEEGIW